MFTVYASNGSKSQSKDSEDFPTAMRAFAKAAKNPPVIEAVALVHDHPEWGASTLMLHTTAGGTEAYYAEIAQWAY